MSRPDPAVLVIDDDVELRDAVADALQAEGMVVATAGNGREGLEYLRAGGRPQVILVDLMMPVMNGWQFCEAKQGDPQLSAIPVIAVSAAAKKDPASPYFLNVEEIVAKPVEIEELIAVVRRYVPLVDGQ